MKYTIYNNFISSISPYEIPKLVSSCGYDGIFFWWGRYKLFPDIDKYRIVNEARRCGLSIDNIHAPFENTNYMWSDKDAESVFDTYMRCIDDCYNLGIDKLIIHPTRTSFWPDHISSKAYERWALLVEYASKCDVILAIENLRAIHFVQTLFDWFSDEYVRFCYDCGHEHCFTPNTNILDTFGNRLCTIHLHDNDTSLDQHRPIGDGSVNWERVVTSLNNYNYQGMINLELHWDDVKDSKYTAVEDYLSSALLSARQYFHPNQ